jgi:hypothetical protein
MNYITKDQICALLGTGLGGQASENGIEYLTKLCNAAIEQYRASLVKDLVLPKPDGYVDASRGILRFTDDRLVGDEPLYSAVTLRQAVATALAKRESGEPVHGQSRFGGGEWLQCSTAHVRMVLENQQEWKGYEVRYLYAHPTGPAQQDVKDAQRRAINVLRNVKQCLEAANKMGESSPIHDTIWFTPYETLFDYIDAAIAQGGAL